MLLQASALKWTPKRFVYRSHALWHGAAPGVTFSRKGRGFCPAWPYDGKLAAAIKRILAARAECGAAVFRVNLWLAQRHGISACAPWQLRPKAFVNYQHGYAGNGCEHGRMGQDSFPRPRLPLS